MMQRQLQLGCETTQKWSARSNRHDDVEALEGRGQFGMEGCSY